MDKRVPVRCDLKADENGAPEAAFFEFADGTREYLWLKNSKEEWERYQYLSDRFDADLPASPRRAMG